MNNHLINFNYGGAEDDNALDIAFRPEMTSERRKWIEEHQNKIIVSSFETEGDSETISFKEFIDNYYLQYCNFVIQQMAPSAVDGQTQLRRKILSSSFKTKSLLSLPQLAGKVSAETNYAQNERHIETAISSMCQNNLASNNISILSGKGQFANRYTGEEAATSHYLLTQVSPSVRLLFPEKDEQFLSFKQTNYFTTEPTFFVPLLPMVLINGVYNFGFWKSSVASYNFEQIAQKIMLKLSGVEDELPPLEPFYKNFNGTIRRLKPNKFAIFGAAAQLSDASFEITELPIGTTTQVYKTKVLEKLAKVGFINSFSEHHTDFSLRFVVNLPSKNLKKALEKGFYNTFQLIHFLQEHLWLFDQEGHLKEFKSIDEIFDCHFSCRLDLYKARQQYTEGLLRAEISYYDNQVRFITEKKEGVVDFENVTLSFLTADLSRRGYDINPVDKFNGKGKIETKNFC